MTFGSVWRAALSAVPVLFLSDLGVGGIALRPVALSQEVQRENTALVEQGKSIYTSLCVRCHGENGDDIRYPEILPLAGIGRRTPEAEISALSAPFVGKVFQGIEARALVAYLKTLRGEKGFAEAGLIVSPYLLSKKLGNVSHYRILDVRPAADYAAGHVPNAVHWNPGEYGETCRISDPVVSQALQQAGINQQTFVVVYDREAGPAATCVWWQLIRSGFKRVAILDGGWQHWLREGYPTASGGASRQSPPHAASAGRQPESLRLRPESGGADGMSYSWRETMGEGGFRRDTEIRSYLENSGIRPLGTYRIEGSSEPPTHLLFVLRLLGHSEVTYDVERQILRFSPSDAQQK